MTIQQRIVSILRKRVPKFGNGSSVKDFASMQQLLATEGLPLSVEYLQECQRFQSLLAPDYTGPSKVFYLDTEYSRYITRELAVATITGDMILDAFIDYTNHPGLESLDVEDIDVYGSRLHTAVKEAAEQGLMKSPAEVAEFLADAGLDSDSVLVEWSTGWHDYEKLKKILELGGRSDIVPKQENVFRPLNAWQNATPGLFAHTQSLIYLFTTGDEKLFEEAHRAASDTRMLISTTATLLKYMKLDTKKGNVRQYKSKTLLKSMTSGVSKDSVK